MTRTHVVDNSERPAQPEPGEDEAVQAPPVREQAPREYREEKERAQREERERQTGE